MRIDPSSVFLNTLASTPPRIALAWMIGTLGAFAPILIRHGFESYGIIQWQFLFLPFYLFLIAMTSGWWGFVAIPLALIFAWRLLVFVREEGSSMELLWIFVLPFLIGIRASEEAWPFAALLALGLIVFVIEKQRRMALHAS